jgi:dTDP-4-amino-4,6-dideoxygalactose transaminase
MAPEHTQGPARAIPFSRPWLSGNEIKNIERCLAARQFCGDKHYSKKCEALLEEMTGAKRVLLTPSCTAALEMSAILCGIAPGDEVILPSFTFSSTANAFELRGATLRFVDINPVTLNIEPACIERAINERTRAIVPVHYAGVACDMDGVIDLARENNLYVIEDAAQGVAADFKGNSLGTLGDLGTFSFHETKNVVCGEGGALLINREDWIQRAEIVREKGTNRSEFLKGVVDKYTWVDVGSSYLLPELSAAFLLAQLESVDEINRLRASATTLYRDRFSELEKEGHIKLPFRSEDSRANNHIFYALFDDEGTRDFVLHFLKRHGISASFHFVPLHSSPYGRKMGYRAEDLPVTEKVAKTLLRFPLFPDITVEDIEFVCDTTVKALEAYGRQHYARSSVADLAK